MKKSKEAKRSKKRVMDVTSGQRFGSWTVLENLGKYADKGKSLQYRCRAICDCGTTEKVLTYNLLNESTKSCGCQSVKRLQEHHASKRLSYKDRRFGNLTVIGEDRIKKVMEDGLHQRYERRLLCQCDCGNQTSVTVSNLNSGSTISCGCSRKKRKSVDESETMLVTV